MTNSIDNFIQYLQENAQASQHTLTAYERACADFAAFAKEAGANDLSEATSVNAEGWVREMAQSKLSPATIAQKVTACRAFFRYAQEGANPFANVKTPIRQKTAKTRVTISDIASMLDAPSDRTPLGLRDKAVLRLLASGMRAGEVTDMTVDNLNFREMDRKSIAAVAEYMRDGWPKLANGVNALFVNADGQALSRQGVWLITRRRGEQAGLSGLNPRILSKVYSER